MIFRDRSYSLPNFYPVVTDFPHKAEAEVNPQGVAFYRQVFEAIKAKGIRLLVNLYHFDLPFALQEDGDGWENKATIKAYEGLCSLLF